jgi:hypothetical protein
MTGGALPGDQASGWRELKTALLCRKASAEKAGLATGLALAGGLSRLAVLNPPMTLAPLPFGAEAFDR